MAVSFQIRVIINSKARSSFAIFPCSVEQSSHPCTLTRSQFNVLPTNNNSRDRRMEFNETHPNSEIMYMYTDHTCMGFSYSQSKFCVGLSPREKSVLQDAMEELTDG